MTTNDQDSDNTAHESNNDGRRLRVLRPGEKFGEYHVVRCLCDGLIAGYYTMQHSLDLQHVTIGIFHHRASNDASFLERLVRLQERTESFKHESIPRIQECMVVDGLTCIRLDEIKGKTLSNIFVENADPGVSGLGEEGTARILAQILGVMGYAHTLGLDHRDLDSDLVFIQEDGSVSILGFGVKATLGTELFESVVSASVSPLTSNRSDGRMDSFDVMSPEYRFGALEDARVDIYGAAVVGYWLLTGQKPVLSRYKEPSSLIPGLSRKWDDYFDKSLERKADRRYQSCRTALQALKQTEGLEDSERSGLIQRQIDRIPVPRQIKERGQLAARIYRIAVFGFVCLTFASFGAYYVHVSLIEELQYTKRVARVAEGDRVPPLRLTFDPPVAKVEFERYDDRFVVVDGKLELQVIPGDYVLRVTAHNHTPSLLRVKVQQQQQATTELNVKLEPLWAQLQVNTTALASVTLIDKKGKATLIGEADAIGQLKLEKGIVAGKYTIKVERKGYLPFVLENQDLKYGDLSVIEAPIKPLPSSLTVLSSPSGASVKFSDIEIGTTPVTLEGIDPVELYRVSVDLEGYRSVYQELDLEPGAANELDFGDLVPLSAELRFDLTFEGFDEVQASELLDEVQIHVGEKKYSFDDPGLQTAPVGLQVVRAVHPQYASKPVRVELKDRDVRKLELELVPRPSRVSLVLPKNLKPEILINGQVVKPKGNTLLIAAKETARIALRIPDHLTMQREFTLEPNERVSWKVEPVRIPGPEIGSDWTLPYIGMPIVWVPAGDYTMGAPMDEQGRLPNEGPRTQVQFTQGFWAGAHEVTQLQYLHITGEEPSQLKGGNHPVDSVLWQDAVDFCEKLTRIESAAGRLPEGYVYRLPSEAEWEYFARAGAETPFHFGDLADAKDGNFQGFYPRGREDVPETEQTYGTVAVGSYDSNAFGIHDVHGNVGEWTLDTYNGRLAGGVLVDPKPRTGGRRATVRGGTWESSAVRVRASVRQDIGKKTQSNAIGFRVILAPISGE